MSQFYCVLGNRDYLKIDGSKWPIYRFVPGQRHWLTSLVYCRSRFTRPPESRLIFDCGAWSYKGLPAPKWSPRECADLYTTLAEDGDIVTAPDHMVLRGMSAEEETYRVDLTLDNAREFLRLCPPNLRPMAVTHGSTVETRARMTRELLDIGYRHIAVGSVAIRAGNRKFIGAILDDLDRLRAEAPFYVHVLGVSALSWYPEYRRHWIDSYDGSSMFFSAFTAGEFHWWNGERVVEYSVKRGTTPEGIPLCDCPACLAMRGQGIDTRMMGSNEHNMGRAVHNINVYRQALDVIRGREPTMAQLTLT